MYAGDVENGTALHGLIIGTVATALARGRRFPESRINVVLQAGGAVTVALTGTRIWDREDVDVLADARLRAAVSLVDGIMLEPDALDLAGIGFCDLTVVNALSDWMCDQLWDGPRLRAWMFIDALLECSDDAPLAAGVVSGEKGLATTFLPSASVFPSLDFDATRLRIAFNGFEQKMRTVPIMLTDRRHPAA